MEKIKKLLNNKLFLLQAAFLLSLTAALGSLALEFGMNLLPCELCWYQRMMMYPLPFIFGAALAQKKTDVFWYGFPMVVTGAVIALYHYSLQVIGKNSLVCSNTGISCAERQIDILGFITIPFMSLLTFIAIGVLLLLLRKLK